MTANWSQEAYRRAYWFAARAHRDQRYPGTELPYLVHLNFVSMEILAALQIEKSADGDLAVQTALLHDVLEDTQTTYEQVESEFGVKIARGVMALTKDSSLEKSLQMQDSLARIQKEPHEIWMVKMADRISNLGPPPPYWTQEKIDVYREEALTIHTALHAASAYLSSRLLQKIDEYARHS